MSARRRPRPARPASTPWTPDEDRALREATSCGLDSSFWHLALPSRRFGEIATRIYETKPPRARLL